MCGGWVELISEAFSGQLSALSLVRIIAKTNVFPIMRHDRKQEKIGRNLRPKIWGWQQLVVLGLIGVLLPGCTFNLTQVFIPLAYAGMGMCIALLVSPSMAAAIVGFVLGGVIGAAVYNNSLKADLMERQSLSPGLQDGRGQ
jgi:hypothetical protein